MASPDFSAKPDFSSQVERCFSRGAAAYTQQARLQAAVAARLGDGAFASLISDGVIAGVGSVIIFLPQILILFTFIILLEDSGYLARAAYLMDRDGGLQHHWKVRLLPWTEFVPLKGLVQSFTESAARH